MTTAVETMTRDQLEATVMAQAAHIRTLNVALERQKETIHKLTEEYDQLSDVVLKAREVLSCA